MEVPGLNPFQQNTQQIQPAQRGVPDLILDAPGRRGTEATQAQPAQQQLPYQAPAQAQIQHSTQTIMNALMEMNIPPTPQNMQMAQMLASYGHPVNAQTMGVLQQVMQGMPDKSAATMEAVLILLTQDLPVNEKTVAAVKQLMNGQALPSQLQGLQQELGPLLQQLRPEGAAAQLQQAQQQANTGQQVVQQVAQNIQSGQAAVVAGATQSAVQQVAGQTKVSENKGDQDLKVSQKTTAQKTDATEKANPPNKAVEAVAESKTEGQNVSTRVDVESRLPSAKTPQDQQSLEKLYLYLNTGPDELGNLPKGGPKLGPDEAVLKLLNTLNQIMQLSQHLSENMNLKDYNQLFIQHQQVIQITGLLENRLTEFQLLLQQAFPELSEQIQHMLQEDGMDMFSKLAQLIEDGQHEFQEKLKYAGNPGEKTELLNQLRTLLEQASLQVTKVQSNLMAREILSQNLPIHVIPLNIHANQETYPAELYVEQNYDPNDPESRPDGDRPLKVVLTLETKNLGRVSVDMAALQDDMGLNLKVLTRKIKLLMDERLQDLQHKIEQEGHYKIQQINCQVVPDLESRQSMLLPQKRTIRSLKRIEGVV